MAVNFSPIFNSQVVDENGDPAVGWKVYSYVAGSSTPLATYTDNTGGTAQSNPIVINSLGFPTTGQIWLTSGSTYKLVLTDENDVVQKTEDNIKGLNDFIATGDEWIASGLTPTYISATSFSVAGDQSSILNAGRRLKTTNTGGTIYSTIKDVAFSSVTTVTVINDSGTLDSGLSLVSYGIISSANGSVPVRRDVIPTFSDVTDPTKMVRMDAGSVTTGTVRVATAQDKDMTLAGTGDIRSGRIWGLRISNNAVDANNDIDIAVGAGRDSTFVMNLTSALTKRIDAVWAVGTNQGGLDTGSVATSTWYYVWLIQRSDTGVVDALFSTSSSSPTMPSNYDRKALIGAVRTDGSSQILKFYQTDNNFIWRTAIAVLTTGTATSDTAVTLTPAVPPVAVSFAVQAYVIATVTGTADGANECVVQVAASTDFATIGKIQGFGTTTDQVFSVVTGETTIPYTGTFNYRNVQSNTTSRSTTLNVLSFKLDIGGS